MVPQDRITPALLAIVIISVSVLAAPSSRKGTRGSDSEDAKAHGSVQASARLMKELMETYKSDSYKKGVIQVELVDDNLYEWEAKVFFTDPEHGLYEDMAQLKSQGKRDYLVLRIKFPENYPNEVPFARVVYPVIRGRRSGAICMYLLSPEGWLPDCTIESLILSVMDQMREMNKVDFNTDKSEYSGEGAVESHKGYVKSHGWDQPRSNDTAWYEGPDSYYD